MPISLTLDSDWCPGFVLDYALSLVYKYPALFFITNNYADSIFQPHHSIGIHPNIEPLRDFSSQSLDMVFNPLLDICPDCKFHRTHKLVWSSSMEEFLMSKGICYDSSIQSHAPYESPIITPSGLARFPITWSDGIYIKYGVDILDSILINKINVVSFHPIHLWLNTSCPSEYLTFKEEVPNLRKAKASIMDKYFKLSEIKANGVRCQIKKLLSFYPVESYSSLLELSL